MYEYVYDYENKHKCVSVRCINTNMDMSVISNNFVCGINRNIRI